MKTRLLWHPACPIAAVFLLSALRIARSDPQAASSGDHRPRVGIIADRQDNALRAIEELVVARLSAADSGVELVEREELQRVVSEQELAALQADPWNAGIRIGQLLHADGIAFVYKDRAGSRIGLRLVESRQGYQVCHFLYPFSGGNADAVVQQLAADLASAIPKLTLDPSRRVLVSVLWIGDATLSPRHSWIQDDLPNLLGAYCSMDPRVLVLERRQMRSLAEEKSMTPDAAGFAKAAYLIDGEIALKPGEPLGQDSSAVVFRVRIRDGALRELAIHRVEGQLSRLDDLMARTAKVVLEGLAASGEGGVTASYEADALLEVAHKRHETWAAEAVIAMDEKDRREQVSALLSVLRKYTVNDEVHNRKVLIEEARAVNRAAELVRDSDSLRRLFCFGGSQGEENGPFDSLLGFLSNAVIRWDDDELADLLRPARRIVRVESERMYAQTKCIADLVDNLKAMSESADDFSCSLDAYVMRLMDDETLPRNLRMGGVAYLVSSFLGRQFVDAYGCAIHRAEPELQFAGYASRVSATWSRNDAVEAFQRLDAVLANPDFVLAAQEYPTLVAHARQTGGTVVIRYTGVLVVWKWFKDILACAPDLREELQNKLETRLRSALATGDLGSFVRLCPEWMRDVLDKEVLVNLLTQALDAWPAQDDLGLGARMARKRRDTLQFHRGDCAALVAKAKLDALPKPATCIRRVLLAHDSPEWLALAASSSKRAGAIYPRKLLLDGNRLWIAFSPPDDCEDDSPGVGLLEMDLPTGKILSFRSGRRPWKDELGGGSVELLPLQGDHDAGHYDSPFALSNICRWNDQVLLGQACVGLHAFPTQESPKVSDLRNARLVTQEQGIGNGCVMSLANAGSTFYIAQPCAVLRWDPAAHQAVLVANTKVTDEPYAPLAGDGAITAIIADTPRERLYVFSGGDSTESRLWRLNLQSGEWRRLPVTKDRFDVRPILSDGRHVYMSCWCLLWHEFGAMRIESQGQLGFRCCFDAEARSLSWPGRDGFPDFLRPKPFWTDGDIVAFGNGTIAICDNLPRHSKETAFDSWTLEFFHPPTEGPCPTLAWTAVLDESAQSDR